MFKLDSPLINFLNKVADIMILSVLFMVFSIPLFTIGASFSAAYYVGLKMVKDEESYIIKTFWKAFRENFKQATVIWLIVAVISGVLILDYRIIRYSGVEFADWMKIGMVTVTVIVLMGVSYMFPLQAHFQNSVKNTMKNAFLMALSHLPTSALLIVIYAVPVLIYCILPQIMPVLFLLSFGLVIYAKSFLLLKIFKKYEIDFEDRSEEECDLDEGLFAESENIERNENDE